MYMNSTRPTGIANFISFKVWSSNEPAQMT